MIFGIVVKGDRDAAAYPELIQRIGDDAVVAFAEPCGNDVRLMGQFVQRLKYFQWGVDRRPEKALVIRDSDCRGAAH
jgi:hypothetical protein